MPPVCLCTANSACPHLCLPRWKNQRGPSCSTCTGFNPLSRALKLRMPFSFVACWRRPSSPASSGTSRTPGACMGQGWQWQWCTSTRASMAPSQPGQLARPSSPCIAYCTSSCDRGTQMSLSCPPQKPPQLHGDCRPEDAPSQARSGWSQESQCSCKQDIALPRQALGKCTAHIVEAFQFVLLVLAEQQRCSKRVHGGIAACLRQRMTAMWQILQVTRGPAECTQPISSSSMLPLVS